MNRKLNGFNNNASSFDGVGGKRMAFEFPIDHKKEAKEWDKAMKTAYTNDADVWKEFFADLKAGKSKRFLKSKYKLSYNNNI